MLKVNGQPVEDAVLESEFGEIKAHYERQGNVSCCERNDEFMGYAKDNVIARVLLTQDARERIADPGDDEIAAAIDRAKAEHGGAEAFYFHLGIAPGKEAEILPTVIDGLKIERLIADLTADVGEPDNAQLREFHGAHIDAFTRPEQVRAAHVFKSVDRVEKREEIIDGLRALRREALDGSDFFALARAHSDKPEDEIDLGFFSRGELMDEFEIIVFSMDVGEVSPVFGSAFGLHVAKLTDRRPATPIPLDDCRDDVAEAWRQEQRQQRVNARIAELRVTATIDDSTPNAQAHAHH